MTTQGLVFDESSAFMSVLCRCGHTFESSGANLSQRYAEWRRTHGCAMAVGGQPPRDQLLALLNLHQRTGDEPV